MSEKTIIGKTLKTSNPKTFVKFSNGAACVDIQFSVMVTYIKNLNLQPIKKKKKNDPEPLQDDYLEKDVMISPSLQ